MQRTPTTPHVGVEERRRRVGQDRPSGESEQAISEEHVAKGGNGPEPSTNGKWPPEAEQNLVGFFRLLMEVDRRINPELYGKPIRDATCHGDETGYAA